MIKMGRVYLITQNVRFVTHDGSINIVRRLDEKYKDLMKFGRIEIGENCFIGANSTIMPNVRIGNNSVVTACSCVTKDIPEGEVWVAFRLKESALFMNTQINCWVSDSFIWVQE